MRILQAMAGGEHGGAEAFFVRFCRALATREIDQRVLLRPHRGREEQLRAAGIETTTTAFGGLLDLHSARRFQREIESYAPDVVFTWMSRASRFCPGHDRVRHRFVHIGRLGGYYDLKYYRRCDHLIGNTMDIVAYMRSGGWPAERSHHLPNFVLADAAPPIERARFGLKENGPLLLALGRLHPNKAFDVLLRALARIPQALLCLAGSGPLEQELRRLASELGIADRVAFRGWQDDVAAYYAAADMYVCPSRIEPLGNVIIEAWAHGVPVVAAAAKGPSALIDDGDNGLLVAVDDPEALAAAIRRLLENRELTDRLVRGGRSTYEAQFTETVVIDKYLDLFRRLTAERDAA